MMLQSYKPTLISIFLVILLFISAKTNSQVSDNQYVLLYQAFDRTTEQFMLRTIDLNGVTTSFDQLTSGYGDILISPDRSRILIEDLDGSYYVFDASNKLLADFTLFQDTDAYLNSIWGWKDNETIVAFEVSGSHIRFYESSDYFISSRKLFEIESIDSTQDDLPNFSPFLLSINHDFTIIASPLIFANKATEVNSAVPQLFVWNIASGNIRLIDSFLYPAEWWNIPIRSAPIWTSHDTLVYLSHDGSYDTQRLNLFDVSSGENRQIYELQCPTCHFISNLAWNSVDSEIVFWEPKPQLGWSLTSIKLDSGETTNIFAATTSPTSIHFSPDTRYIATAIVGDTSAIVVLDAKTRNMLMKHVVAEENLEVIGWIQVSCGGFTE